MYLKVIMLMVYSLLHFSHQKTLYMFHVQVMYLQTRTEITRIFDIFTILKIMVLETLQRQRMN